MRAHIVDHPSRPPEAWLETPTPEGFEDIGVRVPEPGEWYISRSGRAAVASSDAGNRPYTVRRVLRRVEMPVWPTAEYMALPVPEGYEDTGEVRPPRIGDWYLGLSGHAHEAVMNFSVAGRILRKRAAWPSPEYAALPTPAGFIKTGEFCDPREYQGEGTHWLGTGGQAWTLPEPYCTVSDPDPRRYILRRARKWMLVETGEKRKPRDAEFCLSLDNKPRPMQWLGVGSVWRRGILALTEVTE